MDDLETSPCDSRKVVGELLPALVAVFFRINCLLTNADVHFKVGRNLCGFKWRKELKLPKKKVQRKSVIHWGSKVYGTIGTKPNDPFNGEVSEQLEQSVLPKSQVSKWFSSQKTRGDMLLAYDSSNFFFKPSAQCWTPGYGSKLSESWVISPWSSWCWLLGLEISDFLGISKLKKKNRESFPNNKGGFKKVDQLRLQKRSHGKMSIKDLRSSSFHLGFVESIHGSGDHRYCSKNQLHASCVICFTFLPVKRYEM